MLMTRRDRFERILDRAKLQKRTGVVLTRRDLADFLALLAAARDAVIAEEDIDVSAPLIEKLAPFEEEADYP